MKKHVTVTHFTMKIIRTYLYIICNKKLLFVKKYHPISGGIGMIFHTHTIHTHTQKCMCMQHYFSSEASRLLAAGPSPVTH